MLISKSYSQTSFDVQTIKNEFQTFNYEKVIQLSVQYIGNSTNNINNDEIVDVFLMKAISHYSLNQKELSRNSFINILKLNKDYIPDTKKVSPKIISFFNVIKKDFDAIYTETLSDKENIVKESNLIDPEYLSFQRNILKNSFARSILLPGLGHIYIKENVKGWLLCSVSSVLLGSSLFYIYDTNKKESDYLNESDKDMVLIKYDQYNKSYKIRNTLLISYAVVWIYAQIDLLFFSDDAINNMVDTNLNLSTNKFGHEYYNLSFKINF